VGRREQSEAVRSCSSLNLAPMVTARANRVDDGEWWLKPEASDNHELLLSACYVERDRLRATVVPEFSMPCSRRIRDEEVHMTTGTPSVSLP
jgi:hypothetical protein